MTSFSKCLVEQTKPPYFLNKWGEGGGYFFFIVLCQIRLGFIWKSVAPQGYGIAKVMGLGKGKYYLVSDFNLLRNKCVGMVGNYIDRQAVWGISLILFVLGYWQEIIFNFGSTVLGILWSY